VDRSFDSRLGPRSVVSFKTVAAYAGSAPDKTTFSQLGGALPDGSWLGVSELTEFVPGKRYVLFFGAQASLYTAIWAGLAFRVEIIGGRELVLSPEGQAVLSFSSDGVQLGTTSFLAQPVDGSNDLGATLRSDARPSAVEMAQGLTADTFGAAARNSAAEQAAPLSSTALLEPPSDVGWDRPAPKRAQ
jgi:hypothetical protein